MCKSSVFVVGYYVEGMLVDFVCIKFFLSVDGISFDFGFIIFNMMEVYLNVKMIKVVF